MPFSNQFALSVEVTRLLPLSTLYDKGAQAIMTFGRQLKNSGSDIIVEDDLVHVFGRSKISAKLSSSFRTLVAESGSNVPLLEGIMLQAGPGPTVGRALREPPYFSMVVQLSLLSWSYEARALSTALAETLRKRAEGSSSVDPSPTAPSSSDIYGVIQACLKQTSAFNWNMLLQAVANKLGFVPHAVHAPLPTVILQGALDMFPSVQSLPQDRIVHIRLPQDDTQAWGACPLVVWTHHLMDLNVIVRRKTGTVHFGDGTIAQVVIEELPYLDEPSITLLDALEDVLLEIRPEPGMVSMTIDSVLRVPAKGYGNQVIFDSLKDMESRIKAEDKAVLEEIQVTVCAISQLISSHLYHDDARRFGIKDRKSSKFRDCTADIRLYVDRDKILKASKFLFENHDLSQRTVDNYIPSYAYHALKGSELPIPDAFRTVCKRRSVSDDWIAESWDLLCMDLVTLSFLNIAFAHVLNLEDCASLMLGAHSSFQLSGLALSEQLYDWDGRRNLYVRAETWLQTVSAALMASTANTTSLPWDLVCLVSDGGWSAWMPIFSGEDPASLKAGSVFIGRGTPCRNGVWKSFVWDMGAGEKLHTYGCQKVEGAGQQASLRCAEKVSFANPFCGELTNSFVVFACITHHTRRGKRSSRIGFRDLQESLWCTSLLKRCRHGIQKDSSVKLPMNCATFAGFEEHIVTLNEGRLICLTAGSISARWLALASFYGALACDETRQFALLLRDENCCFQCAIDQLALEPKFAILIL